MVKTTYKITLNEDAFDSVQIKRGKGSLPGVKRGGYTKKKKDKISYDNIHDKLTDIGYRVRASKRPNSIEISQANEKGLNKAKAYLNSNDIPYEVVYSTTAKRYFMIITLTDEMIAMSEAVEDNRAIVEYSKDSLAEIMADVAMNLPTILGNDIYRLMDVNTLMDLDAMKSIDEKIKTYIKRKHGLPNNLIDEISDYLDEYALERIAAPNTQIGGDIRGLIESIIAEKKNKSLKEDFDDEHLGLKSEEIFTPEEIKAEEKEIEETPKGPEYGPKAGLSTMLIDAIKSEWDTVNVYNDIVVQAELEGFSDIAAVVRDIANEENMHVGQLQAALETIAPNTESIADGEEEGEKQITAEDNEVI